MRPMSRWLGLRPWKRHSLVLAVLGTVYLLLGLNEMIFKQPASRYDTLQVAVKLASWFPGAETHPLAGWGVLFALVGLLAILSSRWPPASETWGYTALSSLSALWGTFYVWGVMAGAPFGTIAGFLVWSGLAFLWWAISGLVNPTTLEPPT